MARSNAAPSVDAYIRSFPPRVQQLLRQLRETIRQMAPKATEKISYGIAGYQYKGTLIFFAGFQKHVSLYPAPRQVPAFQKELSAYKGGKGTIQFPLDQPLPLALIRKIIRYRLKENEARDLAASQKKIPPLKKWTPGKNEAVEKWIQQLSPEKKSFTNTVRKIIQKAAPSLQERIKWNAPSYYDKEDIVTFGPYRDDRILLVFHHPAVVKIKSDLLEGLYKDRRLVYLQNAADARRKTPELKKILTQIIQSIDKK